MSSRMRTVSFVERLELEFEGNIFNQAIALGDVDNDQGNELVVGNIHGELAIFKADNVTRWRTCSDLGMITCIGIGDICNRGKNFLVNLSAEGWCDLFEVKADDPEETNAESNSCSSEDLVSFHHQHLPPNNKVMIMSDIDGDGRTELVIGYSDRCVRTFRWCEPADESNSCSGEFIQLDQWHLAAQIGGITTNHKADGSPDLMVAQPGGTYVSLIGREASRTNTGFENPEPLIEYHDLQLSSRTRNVGVTTEIVGGISKDTKEQKDSKETFYAICTLDGTLKLMVNDKIVWSIQVDHQLFALTKLDFTGDNTDEVIACSWDGNTYIVSHDKQVVRFQFEESVAGFCAGNYAMTKGENMPCLIYATFNDKIYIYHNVSMPQIQTTNLLEAVDNLPETKDLLSLLNIDTSSKIEVRKLYHWCLYGQHTTNDTS